MHFSVLVLTDAPNVTRDNAQDVVEPLLAPFEENYDEAEDTFTGHWDWWSVGGRWTGAFDGYNPEKDERNTEVCNLCGGTGTRPGGREQFGSEWVEWSGGCNGCRGEGTRTKWPTSWAPHDGDVQPVASLNGSDWPSHIAAVLTPDGEWHGGLMSDTPKCEIRGLVEAHPTATAILVDCHS